MPDNSQLRGPLYGGSGTAAPATAGFSGAARTNDAHARFVQAALEGRLFSGGIGTVTTIANATFTTATLGATCTPILGIWNPATSLRNAIIYQAILQVVLTALQNTGGGPFVWASSVGNAGLTLGNAPFNRLTGNATGSAVKDMSGVALTGLTNNLVVRQAAGIAGGSVFNIATLDTAAGFGTTLAPSVENIDGSWVVPPGGVLALLASVTPVAQSVASGALWEEAPIFS